MPVPAFDTVRDVIPDLWPGCAHVVLLWTVRESNQRRGLHAAQDDTLGLHVPGCVVLAGLRVLPADHIDRTLAQLLLPESRLGGLRLSVADAALRHQHGRSESDTRLCQPRQIHLFVSVCGQQWSTQVLSSQGGSPNDLLGHTHLGSAQHTLLFLLCRGLEHSHLPCHQFLLLQVRPLPAILVIYHYHYIIHEFVSQIISGAQLVLVHTAGGHSCHMPAPGQRGHHHRLQALDEAGQTLPAELLP